MHRACTALTRKNNCDLEQEATTTNTTQGNYENVGSRWSSDNDLRHLHTVESIILVWKEVIRSLRLRSKQPLLLISVGQSHCTHTQRYSLSQSQNC